MPAEADKSRQVKPRGPQPRPDTEWTPELIKELTRLWVVEKWKTSRIAKHLKVSRNVVLGKVHRLKLEARPSPIKKRSSGVPLFEAPVRLPGPRPGIREQRENARPPATSVPGILGSRSFRLTAQDGCKWPIGDPTRPSFHFCQQQRVGGRPYCAEHIAIAYVRVHDKRENAA